MDGNQHNMPELPTPQESAAESKPNTGEYPESSTPEKQAVAGEAIRQQQPAMPVVTDDATQIAQPIDATSIIPASDSSTTSQQAQADDTDVIEKEWVERAKTIVTKTRNDPREQSRELSRFKAEYVQKRFDKQLKVVEDAN